MQLTNYLPRVHGYKKHLLAEFQEAWLSVFQSGTMVILEREATELTIRIFGSMTLPQIHGHRKLTLEARQERELQVSAVGNYGYICTGYNGTYYNDMWQYDPSTNTWTQKANFPGAGRHNAIGFGLGNYGYVGTGFDGSNYYSDFYQYDPSSNTWTTKANFGGSPREQSAGFTIGSYGYIGTGYNNACLSDFWQYDPVANTWAQKANYGGFVINNAVGFADSCYGYIGTGDDDSQTEHNDVWQFDPATNQWTPMANFPGVGRQWAVAFTINGNGYLGTGFTHTGDENDFWKYIPATPCNGCVTHFANNPQIICNGSSYVINGHTYTIAGNYLDTLITIHGCDSIVTTQLTVNPSFSVNNPQTICNGGAYVFNGHTYTTTGNYFDTLSTLLGCDSIIKIQLTVNPTFSLNNHQSFCTGGSYVFNGHTYTSTGNYYDSLTTVRGCDSVLELSLVVYPADTNLQSNAICKGSNFDFYGTPISAPGTYYHTLVSSHGCDSVIIADLSVDSLLNFSAGKDTTIFAGSSVLLYASGGVTYQWSPATYLNNPAISNPVSTPLNNISYVVTITDASGCSEKDTVTIIVDESDLWIPNVFDPNNPDPLNQTFHASGKGIKDFELVIYNRWGEKVFESNDINQGWDGTFKGEKLPKGVFAYYVKATLYNEQEIVRKGNVSLIR